MRAALPAEGAGGDQERRIMSRASIHIGNVAHRSLIAQAWRCLAGRHDNGRIDAAGGSAVRSTTAIEGLCAGSFLRRTPPHRTTLPPTAGRQC
jgi:hypothetical protein